MISKFVEFSDVRVYTFLNMNETSFKHKVIFRHGLDGFHLEMCGF